MGASHAAAVEVVSFIIHRFLDFIASIDLSRRFVFTVNRFAVLINKRRLAACARPLLFGLD